MRLLAIEGLDKAGKASAARVLQDVLASEGLCVQTMTFPRYDTATGDMIRRHLTGENPVDSVSFELLQAADKQTVQREIQELEDAGTDVLILDRYVHSEIAYGAYEHDTTWLAALARYIRRPDAVIYLDVEPEVSLHRHGEYQENDAYESDLERLRATHRAYQTVLARDEDRGMRLYKINANDPQPIVKSAILNTASCLYDLYTGQNLSADVMHQRYLSSYERQAKASWERFNGCSDSSDSFVKSSEETTG